MYRRLGELMHMRYVVKYKKEIGILEKLKTVYKDYITWYLDNKKGVQQRAKIHVLESHDGEFLIFLFVISAC